MKKLYLLQFCFLLLLLTISFQYIYCQNSSIPGDIESYQTFNSIGIEWPITGDENHNAECLVNYKKKGNSEWKKGLPLYRIDFNGFNMMAGSILFLEPHITYQIELTFYDSDGGSIVETIQVTTRQIPEIPTNGETYYVIPGDGGGIGTSDDPFMGVDAAQSIAKPGDVFILASGNYASSIDNGRIEFTTSGEEDNYIVWKADEGAKPILSGARINCNFMWLEGITILDLKNGIIVGPNQPKGVVITKNHFIRCHYGIFLNNNSGKNWYITDNIIEGDITDYTTGVYGGEGIELNHSDGCVVAYNKIFNTADGISYPGKNCDIFRNEIYNVSDDGIEFDYGYANNRAWENRITNAYNNGISFQPMNGAPMYVIRNQVYVHKLQMSI